MGELRGNLDALTAALAAGKTVQEAAALAEMGVATAYRRLQDDEVQQRIRDVRTRMFEQATGRLADALSAAVDCLTQSLDAQNESVRVRAAMAILDHAVKWRESDDITRRVAELETALGRKDGGHGSNPPADAA